MGFTNLTPFNITSLPFIHLPNKIYSPAMALYDRDIHQQSHIDERTSEKETHCNFEIIIRSKPLKKPTFPRSYLHYAVLSVK